MLGSARRSPTSHGKIALFTPGPGRVHGVPPGRPMPHSAGLAGRWLPPVQERGAEMPYTGALSARML